MTRTILLYGLALALGAVVLQWLDYRIWSGAASTEIYVTLIGLAFLALGVFVGLRLARPRGPQGPFEPNRAAQDSLGITAREYEVLGLLAAGQSNKEIARRLELSPNTVKTHVARLYEKLEAVRRTDAVLKARELGLIP